MLEETKMGTDSYEVLPVGSLYELITIRELMCELLEQEAKNDIDGMKQTINKVREFYKTVL